MARKRRKRYRDTLTLRHDVSADRVQQPDYQDLAPGIPGQIFHVKGQETWRGRQMEERADFVVVLRDVQTTAVITAKHQFRVDGGRFTGRLLNVTSTQVHQHENMRRAELDVFCTELVG